MGIIKLRSTPKFVKREIDILMVQSTNACKEHMKHTKHPGQSCKDCEHQNTDLEGHPGVKCKFIVELDNIIKEYQLDK